MNGGGSTNRSLLRDSAIKALNPDEMYNPNRELEKNHNQGRKE